MTSKKLLGMIAALVAVLALTATASAQDEAAAPAADSGGGGGSPFASGGQVDRWRLGGGMHLMVRGGAIGGLRAFADFPLHQYFTLGPEVMIGGGGGGAVFTFAALPKGRLPLMVGGKLLEPTLSIPLGLGVFTNGSGAAFYWGFMPGCQYFFNDMIGIHGEIGVNGFAQTFGFAGFAMNLGVTLTL